MKDEDIVNWKSFGGQKLIIGYITLIFGLTMAFSSLWIPPVGVIDGSVLGFIGESLSFISVLLINVDFKSIFNRNKQ